MTYSDEEELKAKYGRNSSSAKPEPDYQSPGEAAAKEKIPEEIIDTKLQEESAENLLEKEITGKKDTAGKKKKAPDTPLVKFLKIVVYIAIIITVSSIITAFFVKNEVNNESAGIIEQIKKAEDLYYSVTGRYFYFSKTSYSDTLGVDLSKRKYFMSYEVVPNIEFGNYEIKLYGATNAFTITYYYVKSLILNDKS